MKLNKYLNNAFNSIVKKKYGNLKLNKNKTLNPIKKYIKLKQYVFKEWTPFLQEKSDGGFRPLISPPLKDRILLKALADYCSFILKPYFAKVDEVSYAYQKGKGPRNALLKLKELFRPGDVILKIDIQKFFNNINKRIAIDLLKSLDPDKYVMSLIEKSLSPTLSHNKAYDLAIESIRNGIPQGNAISAVISNLYLLEFDQLCIAKNLRLIRYADDMIIIVDNKEMAYEVLNFVEYYLNTERGLSIHPLLEEGKTAIFLLPQIPSLTYLGIVFNGFSLLPSIKCQAILSNKIKSIAQDENKTATDRIKGIKTCIKQWCGYYAFTDAPKSRLKKLSATINHNCKKYLYEQWIDIDLVKLFYHYKNRQNKKGISIFNIIPKSYGEEYYWLYANES